MNESKSRRQVQRLRQIKRQIGSLKEKGERKRKENTLMLCLIHEMPAPADGAKGRSWNSVSFFHMDGRNLVTGAITAASQGLH